MSTRYCTQDSHLYDRGRCNYGFLLGYNKAKSRNQEPRLWVSPQCYEQVRMVTVLLVRLARDAQPKCTVDHVLDWITLQTLVVLIKLIASNTAFLKHQGNIRYKHKMCDIWANPSAHLGKCKCCKHIWLLSCSANLALVVQSPTMTLNWKCQKLCSPKCSCL